MEDDALAVALTEERNDRYREVRESIEPHRKEHGCAVPLLSVLDGRGLAVLTRATHSSYVLEVGSALGYAGLNIVESFGRTGKLDIIEDDETHAGLAEDAFAQFALSDRVRVNWGRPEEILTALNGPYDLVVVNGAWAAMSAVYDDLVRLTRTGGSLLLRTGAAEGAEAEAGARAGASRMANDYRLAAWFESGLKTVLASRVR